MKTWLGRLGSVSLTAAIVLAAAAYANGETFTLELKRLEIPGEWPEDYPWALRDGVGNCAMMWGGDAEHVDRWLATRGLEPLSRRPDFSEVVRQEPDEYHAARPLRGVVKLGDGYFGFVLDTEQTGSNDYTRLYFDQNHNGDLTDDGVVEGKETESKSPPTDDQPRVYRTESKPTVSQEKADPGWEFPRVDLTIEVDGREVEYGFFFSAKTEPHEWLTAAPRDPPISAWLQPGVYREGKIKLGGKTHRVAMIDFDVDGRFDDREMTCQQDGHIEWPDLLLVDPEPGKQGATNAIWHLLEDCCLRRLTTIDNTFCVVDVSPDGDRLTLSPPPEGVGHLIAPADGFTATLDGDLGPLDVSGDTAHPIELPAGQWKLREYTIDLSEHWAEANEGRTSDEPRIPNLSQIVVRVRKPRDPDGPRGSFGAHEETVGLTEVEADAGGKPLEIVQGRTIEFPFGPPFRPVVTPTDRSDRRTVELELSLIGTGGERCTSLTVDGQPADAWLTVTTPDGHLVDHGKYAWEGKPFRSYVWQVPWDRADEYHLGVTVDAGPFEVDQNGQTVIRLSELGLEKIVAELRREVAELRAEIERLREQARPQRTSDARRP